MSFLNRGIEIELKFGMFFRRMYCSKDGSKLKLYKMSKIAQRGEMGFKKRIGNKTNLITESQEIYFFYICPTCGKMSSYEQQLITHKRQKKLKKKILTAEDLQIQI